MITFLKKKTTARLKKGGLPETVFCSCEHHEFPERAGKARAVVSEPTLPPDAGQS